MAIPVLRAHREKYMGKLYALLGHISNLGNQYVTRIFENRDQHVTPDTQRLRTRQLTQPAIEYRQIELQATLILTSSRVSIY